MVSTLWGLSPKSQAFIQMPPTILFISGDGNSIFPDVRIKNFAIILPALLLSWPTFVSSTFKLCLESDHFLPAVPLPNHCCPCRTLTMAAWAPCFRPLLPHSLLSAFSTSQPVQVFKPVNSPCLSSAQNHPRDSLPIQSKKPSLSYLIWTLLLLQLCLLTEWYSEW